MNLQSLNDSTLVEATETLVRKEREILSVVLHHLREIDRRRLFSGLGYKSLFDFAVRRLGYPEDQAYRRIAAMRLLKELPEIELKIERGELSLTHIGLAHSHFKQERKIQNKELSVEQKLVVFEKIANKSVREAEKITLAMSSNLGPARPDRVSQMSDSRVELRFVASSELQTKIEQLKGMLAHKHPSLSLGELFEKLCDLGLLEWSHSKSKHIKIAAPRKRRVNLSPQAPNQLVTFTKAESKCENCGSQYALEVDHIVPRGKGGSSEPQNLRVLCRSCNQRAAIIEFGQNKMDQYLN